MKIDQTGWVIINIGHPKTGEEYIVYHTFFYTRKGSISGFIEDTGHTWEYWKRKYNFRAVRATIKVTV